MFAGEVVRLRADIVFVEIPVRLEGVVCSQQRPIAVVARYVDAERIALVARRRRAVIVGVSIIVAVKVWLGFGVRVAVGEDPAVVGMLVFVDVGGMVSVCVGNAAAVCEAMASDVSAMTVGN